MDIKATTQGWLVYGAMGAYVLGMILALMKQCRWSRVVYGAGFGAAAAAWIYRWNHVGHVPMQNMFEVFLTMGALIWPLTQMCRRILGSRMEGGDMLLGAVILFPVGFVFHAEPEALPPALQSPLFAPHVAVYMLSYVIMAKAAFQAGGCLYYDYGRKGRGASELASYYEQMTYQMTRLGFPLLTMGLFLGSWWGAEAWGDYWGWDPKELWSLASWLMFIIYFHWRYMYGSRYPRVNSLLAVGGFGVIIITLLWVNLSRVFSGMHSYASG